MFYRRHFTAHEIATLKTIFAITTGTNILARMPHFLNISDISYRKVEGNYVATVKGSGLAPEDFPWELEIRLVKCANSWVPRDCWLGWLLPRGVGVPGHGRNERGYTWLASFCWTITEDANIQAATFDELLGEVHEGYCPILRLKLKEGEPSAQEVFHAER